MTGPARGGTRAIARAAVRAQLAQVAVDLFTREGFDRVTINDLAAAAGVSRSTVLRYFATKEDAVLGSVDAQGDLLADALRARPADEDDWTALRRTLDAVTSHYRTDPAGSLAFSRLVMGTPALCAKSLEKQAGWRPRLAAALAERHGAGGGPGDLRPRVLAAAAVECFNIATNRWAETGGSLELETLIDEAFAVLAPRRSPATR
jgi:AcrR family transcriptional regulator